MVRYSSRVKMFLVLNVIIAFVTVVTADTIFERKELCNKTEETKDFEKVFIARETILFGNSATLHRLDIEKEKYMEGTSIGKIFSHLDSIFVAGIHFGKLPDCKGNDSSSTCDDTKQKSQNLMLILTQKIGQNPGPSVKGYIARGGSDRDYYGEVSDLPWGLEDGKLVLGSEFWVHENMFGVPDDLIGYDYTAMTFDEKTGTMYLAVIEKRASSVNSTLIFHKKLDDNNEFGKWENTSVDKAYTGLIDYKGILYGFEPNGVVELDKTSLSEVGPAMAIHSFMGCDDSSPLVFSTASSGNSSSNGSDTGNNMPTEDDKKGETTSTTSTTTPKPDPPKKGFGWIIWLIIAVVLIAVIVIVLCFCCGKKSEDQPEDKAKSGTASKVVSESDGQKTGAGAVKSTGSGTDSKALGAVGSKSSTASNSDVSSVRSGAV